MLEGAVELCRGLGGPPPSAARAPLGPDDAEPPRVGEVVVRHPRASSDGWSAPPAKPARTVHLYEGAAHAHSGLEVHWGRGDAAEVAVRPPMQRKFPRNRSHRMLPTLSTGGSEKVAHTTALVTCHSCKFAIRAPQGPRAARHGGCESTDRRRKKGRSGASSQCIAGIFGGTICHPFFISDGGCSACA